MTTIGVISIAYANPANINQVHTEKLKKNSLLIPAPLLIDLVAG
ncbi:hypothetical protein PTRA_a2576 [Pseudoalteromonas translucida KMM 520]|uniref:Uncharacterized protein n=1 Tax=Pseudoalteromonas translucida KMM 520 TaxID=1315283 RepID=A0A0U2X4B7_9GAMM|nr:hypothetical protein PTRA_a2576 [Pseudoalteromonas translucida KMM 520]